MASMTADELRAEIEATRREAEAEEARLEELRAETEQARERRNLRAELHLAMTRRLRAQRRNDREQGLRRRMDDGKYDNKDVPAYPRKHSVLHASGGASTHCAATVARGEYVWRIIGCSWMESMLWQEYPHDDFDCLWSTPFDLGTETFHFAYNPWAGRPFSTFLYNSNRDDDDDDDADDDEGNDFFEGDDHYGIVSDDDSDGSSIECDEGHPNQSCWGSVAIVPSVPSGRSNVLLRYRIYAKAQNGEFMQWGETKDVIYNKDAFKPDLYIGPDVYWRRANPPAVLGIFGLSHQELLRSQWVQDDTLTLKFELEVRPQGGAESKPWSLATKVPAPTLSQDNRALFEEGTCSDVTFRVQGEVIQAHSQVLCARSEVFKKQLGAGMQESVSKTIVIEDCDITTFKSFLQFLYTDCFPDLQNFSGTASERENGSSSPQQSLMQAPYLANS